MNKRNVKIQNIIWTLLLVLYPFVGVNQGLSVVDTTYSLSNFAFFPEMRGTWAVATYLANALGYALMQLPFGNTMLGMNIYTRFVIVIMAVTSFYTLKKVFPAWITALTQIAAIGLCWAPSTTLYHYLTYLFIQLASLALFQAFTAPKDRQKRWFIAAGVCLGMNVGVRMPNVTHAALILAVWYGTYVICENKEILWRSLWKNTLWCICGYLPGLLVPLAAICRQFGARAYPDMVRTLFAMTEKAQDYKPAAMVTGIFGGYFEGIRWFLLAAGCIAAGSAFAAGLNRYLVKKTERGDRTANCLFMLGYTAVLLVLFRFFWGRGMFDLRYYNYRSVYNLTVLFLWTALAVCGYVLIKKGVTPELKILAVLVLLQMFLIPLGGNNGLYPVMNQMFLVYPVTVGTLYHCLIADGTPLLSAGRNPELIFPVKAAVFMLAAFLLVQSVGFHFCFALQDGVWEEDGGNRNAVVQNNPRVAGIYTMPHNAQTIEGLSGFILEHDLMGKQVILYGDVPGLGYILNMPSALSTFWPDLDSYRVAECRHDLKELDGRIRMKGADRPVVIVSDTVAAWLEGSRSHDTDLPAFDTDEKLGMLRQFMEEHAYEKSFSNRSYTVYQ